MRITVSYAVTLFNTNIGEKLIIDEFNGYPPDLERSKLFYVETDFSETSGNIGSTGPSYGKINRKVKKKLAKKYPYEFTVFPPDYKKKGNEYFLKEGCKYRMLLLSTWYSYQSGLPNARTQAAVLRDPSLNSDPDRKSHYNSPNQQWKQQFLVVVEDISTGQTFAASEYEWMYRMIKAFVERTKAGIR